MTKLKTVLLASIIAMTLVVITQQVKAQSAQLKTYTDPEVFFTLQYPSNWTIKYEPSVSKFDEARTWLYVDGKLFAPLSIRVSTAPSASTAPGTQKDLEDNFDFAVSLLKQRGYDILQSKFGLYKIDRQDAGGIQFQTPLQEKGIQVSSVFNGKLIVITFKTSESSYNSQIPEVEKVIDSIKITGV
jgi:hypothetical protein